MNESRKEKNVIPSNVSPVRYMINEVYPSNTQFLGSYEEAKITKDAVVIMEGDDGGQIYLVCPMQLVKCDKETLEQLLSDLDEIAWACNNGDGKGIYYEVKKVGEEVSGGMGGAKVENALWVHNKFREKGFESKISDVIEGKIKKIF